MSVKTVSTTAFPILADGVTHSLGIDATGNMINYDTTLGLRVHAFVLWDQNGGVVTVHDSENMTSVTRPATGHTDFVFTTPTPDVNFVPVYVCGVDQGSNPFIMNERDYSTSVRTTTTIKTIVHNNNDTIKDPAISSLTIYVRA